jgi:hypothetical protein
MNPNIYETWRDEETGEDKVFEGHAYLKHGRFWKVKVSELHKTFDLARKGNRSLSEEEVYSVKIRFHLSGMKAEIV